MLKVFIINVSKTRNIKLDKFGKSLKKWVKLKIFNVRAGIQQPSRLSERNIEDSCPTVNFIKTNNLSVS